MAADSPESLPSPSPPPPSSISSLPHFSTARHYYVAVDRLRFKMDTLVDLLGVAGRRPFLPIVVCCSYRDELDAVCSAVSGLSFISLSPLYSDQAESERTSILEKFRQSTMEWSQHFGAGSGNVHDIGDVAQKSSMIVVTDACLPVTTSGEPMISARILINYELPSRKETYLRRMSTCLAPDGIVINMVVGGEVVTLRGIEEASGLIIAEMPINISEIL
ncbi:RNA helicase protein [Dioscorea alata]|uniref:RNA helicase protein n=1 Tax=Dioscorea alata TaxID=55571 RepID=A0ACB7VX45_DIOAL|nr:RNA helicase protein [Dioscorea alata]